VAGIVADLTLALAIVLSIAACSGAATLQVGECFDPPTTIGETVEDVVRKPCTDPHGAEVISVSEYAPTSLPYPTDEEFFAFFEATCEPAFNAYTGIDFATAAEYDMAAFTPTSEGWASGDRKVICYAVHTDETPLTKSLKKA
jgi:hypothetical protein